MHLVWKNRPLGPEEFTLPCELFKTRGKLQQRFISIALSLHFRHIFVPQNMYHRTKDMHRHAKIGSILINKEHKKKVNNRSFFNSALRASLGSAAFRKGPYRTNSGTTSVQTRLATRWHGSVTFICTVTPRLRKTELGVKQRRTNMDGILHSSCTASQASIHFSDVSETNSHGTLDPKRICRAK